MPTLRHVHALLRPHGAALVILALFLAAGLAVLDDYGASADEIWQRVTAEHNINVVLSIESDAVESGAIQPHDQFYGMAFEVPLLLIERTLGLQGGREIFLARHLMIRLFFLAGGLFAYLLARRLLGGGSLQAAAMLFFLLSPRLYAHSFFNSKDLPFLVMFMVALFLAHRAFRRETLWSFALLGAGVGILMNLRIMGVVLLAVVPAARSLDLIFASGRAERKRAALTIGAFALAGAGAIYATMPHLWVDPIGRAFEWWTTLSSHPFALWQLLGGEPVVTSNLPSRYLPVWFSITNVPAVLLLGGVGALAACGAGAFHFRRALRNTRLRFLIFILACFAIPVLAVILLKPNVYNGWRQLHFLWAPFSLLAVYGLYALASAFRQKRLRTATYGATAAAVGAAVVSMILIHPHQQVYFNFLVDRTTSDRLSAQYELDYWWPSGLEALRLLLRERPGATVPVASGALEANAPLLTNAERARVVLTDEFAAFTAADSRSLWGSGTLVGDPYAPSLHTRRLYGSPLYSLVKFAVDEEDAAPYRATYGALSSADPALSSVFDVHLDGNSLVYVKERCAPPDIARSVFLHVYPETLADAPQSVRAFGFQNMDFYFRYRGAAFDGKCMAVIPLPDYPIARVETGQTGGDSPWEGEFAIPGGEPS